jgi:SpoVK/Ycf46/Vps4 family AAA+-type ATPase
MSTGPASNELRIVMPTGVPEDVAAVCRSRLLTAVTHLLPHVNESELLVQVGTRMSLARLSEQRYDEERASKAVSRVPSADDDPAPDRYSVRPPTFTFDQLVVPGLVREELIAAMAVLNVETIVFDEWGLRAIEPYPRTALNFHGPPGTGKTLAAHAIANRLSKAILVASYAEIESKYHGDGPKNVKAIFHAAERNNAVLFIDEADSLLSRRLTSVTQGSEQAINSMRSQLLICLEQFHGVVIFSTNLVENYDKAFETRVRHVHFPLPDADCRREIWRRHLVPRLPVDATVDPSVLAERIDDICGRDIKNAVIDAAVRAAVSGAGRVSLDDLVLAAGRIKSARVGAPRRLHDNEASSAAETIRVALGAHEGAT